MSFDDLRAAVQAGILSESQAARLNSLIQSRAGTRADLPAEDEPFEFFRGFSEIFVAVGLIILLAVPELMLAGIASDSETELGSRLAVLFTPALSFALALYFTLRRRMNLPSMVLATSFAIGCYTSLLQWMVYFDFGLRATVVLPVLLSTLAMVLWYWRFRLPFSMALLGLFALLTLYSLFLPKNILEIAFRLENSGWAIIFDLRESPVLALATLGFGLVAFAAGMWFDTRDPHRLGRHSATAFWLHLLAATALVNTVAMTIYNSGASHSMLLLILAVLVATFLALVIDRRSFLTAAMSYIAVIIFWLAGGDDAEVFVILSTTVLLGLLITAIGTWWVPLRAALMRLLPDFPGKNRLPPYSRPE
jgi:hypothetical protein